MAILGAKKWNGAIYYNKNPSDDDTYTWPDDRTRGSGGGTSGEGGIWSSVAQVIWIKYDGAPAYPVYVEPGYNEIKFWIPNIFPEDLWIEAKLEIEAPDGYILIPAGFEWDIITGENAPPAPPNSKRIDKIKFKDYYDVVINYVPPTPPTGEPIIDEFSFKDLYNIIINTIHTEQSGNIDRFKIEDFKDIDLITPIPPGGRSYIDNMTFRDLVNTLKRHINKLDDSGIDDSNYTDVYDIELN